MMAPRSWAPDLLSDERPRVLVVDDDPMVGRAVGRLLAIDHAVTVVASGAEALARLDGGERFDAILSDMNMPDLDGMGLYRRLFARHRDACGGFILLTGGHITPELERFLAEYAIPCAEKPFAPATLTRLVRDTTARSRAA